MQKNFRISFLRSCDFLGNLAKLGFVVHCGGIYGYSVLVWEMWVRLRIRPIRPGYTRPVDGPQLAWDRGAIIPLSARYRIDLDLGLG